MLRRTLTLALLAAPAFAADWVEYRSGPFHVFSNAGDRAARERLTQLEQLRYVLGPMLGKSELQTIWPVHLALFRNGQLAGGTISSCLQNISAKVAIGLQPLRLFCC